MFRKAEGCEATSCVEVDTDFFRAAGCDSGTCVEVGFIKAAGCGDASCVEVGFAKAAGCGEGACVEVAVCNCTEGEVLVRDSKNLDQAPLSFTRDEWRVFCDGVRAGEFDV